MLSKEQIERFKKIYKEEFGKDISDEEAREKGEKLVRLVKLVYESKTKEKREIH